MSDLSRRGFITRVGAGAAVGAVPLAAPAVAAAKPGKSRRPVSAQTVVNLFSKLPGTVGLKIHASPAHGDRGLLIAHNASRQMFVGSAIKTFALCKALRQSDSADVTAKIAARQLALNESVWNADSQSFNPPNLEGKVSEQRRWRR